ncbi:MAG: hypothetical protein ACTSWQ_09160 [Candidatus Thorarchaeota archaeon]
MKINRENFVAALEKVRPALGINVLVPAFQGFIIKGRSVTATDGVVVINTKAVEDTGLDCVVPGPQFYDLLKKLKDNTVELKQEKESLVVKSKRGAVKGTFTLISKIELPSPPDCDVVAGESFNQLATGLNLCRYSVSKDETTGVLCGVHVRGNKIISTDRYRISMYQMDDLKFDTPFTIPLKFVNILVRCGTKVDSVGVSEDNQMIVMLEDGTLLYTGLLVGEYKDLTGFFPDDKKDHKTIRFPDKLEPVLERHITFLKDIEPTGKVTNVTLSAKKCRLNSSDMNLGELEEVLDLVDELEGEVAFPINPMHWRDVSKICSEFLYYPEAEDQMELILFRTDNLAYLCKPDRKDKKSG